MTRTEKYAALRAMLAQEQEETIEKKLDVIYSLVEEIDRRLVVIEHYLYREDCDNADHRKQRGRTAPNRTCHCDCEKQVNKSDIERLLEDLFLELEETK